MQVNQAIITLGGRGTRLRPISRDCPKPLYPINGYSTLEHTIMVLNREGVDNFIFLCGYMAQTFKDIASNFELQYNCRISIHTEEWPMGEAGALSMVRNRLQETFLFVNGDIVFDIDLSRVVRSYVESCADITLLTHITSHPEDSDCIKESVTGRVTGYKLKDSTSNDTSFCLGYSGIALLRSSLVDKYIHQTATGSKASFSLFRDVAVGAYLDGQNVFSYNTSEYLKDMGTPARFKIVASDLRNNVVGKKSYKSKQAALFIDRDNTIITVEPKMYITSSSQIQLKHATIRRIADIAKGYTTVICITNQPQISMGKLNYGELIDINSMIASECSALGLVIDAFYFCPHHPHDGFQGEISELKIKCSCRKPMPGLVYQAAIERNIDLMSSLFIGDSPRDKELSDLLSLDYIDVSSLD